MFPNLNNPPKPCITRWGTWIKAAIYYSENFKEICDVLDELDDDEAESIRNAKLLFQKASMKSDLVYIKHNFECLCSSITRLETKGLPISESLAVIERVKENIENTNQNVFIDKFNKVLNRNTGLKTLIKIKNYIYFNKTETDEYIEKLSPSEILAFKYAPVTSTDVEHIFSMYSSVLCDNRRSFLFENLKKHMIVHCNKDLFE